jgi:hypothetical protein
MKDAQTYKLDLTEIEGNGEFQCPKCGTAISPDDETEKTYTLIEAKVKNQILQELLIRCNKCTRKIQLTGFALLQKIQLQP